MLPVMTPRITIDWEPGRRPVSGALTGAEGRTQAFNGWLELMSLLQVALAPDPDETAHTTPRETP